MQAVRLTALCRMFCRTEDLGREGNSPSTGTTPVPAADAIGPDFKLVCNRGSAETVQSTPPGLGQGRAEPG